MSRTIIPPEAGEDITNEVTFYHERKGKFYRDQDFWWLTTNGILKPWAKPLDKIPDWWQEYLSNGSDSNP